MSPAPPPPTPPCELLELMVRCLEELERGGPPGVAALLAEHPADAPRLVARLVILGDLGLLPEAAPPAESA